MAKITSTDRNWEDCARQDPFFAVLSDPKFCNANLNADLLQEFFESGEHHVDHVFNIIRAKIKPSFQPSRILDFGCGVGRLVVAFANRSQEVVGIDVSPTMLMHARANCEKFGTRSVRLIHLDDLKSLTPASFDLIHSSLVFQHIPVTRGESIFGDLINLLCEGGVGAVHFALYNTQPALRRGFMALRERVSVVNGLLNLARGRSYSTGLAQMNSYSMNRIFRILLDAQCPNLHVELGSFGAIVYFEKLTQTCSRLRAVPE